MVEFLGTLDSGRNVQQRNFAFPHHKHKHHHVSSDALTTVINHDRAPREKIGLQFLGQLKRELSPHVSTAILDDTYETALRHGALGGKLLGAGGAGFMLFYVPEERKADVKDALCQWLHVPFKFDWEGAKLIASDV